MNYAAGQHDDGGWCFDSDAMLMGDSNEIPSNNASAPWQTEADMLWGMIDQSYAQDAPLRDDSLNHSSSNDVTAHFIGTSPCDFFEPPAQEGMPVAVACAAVAESPVVGIIHESYVPVARTEVSKHSRGSAQQQQVVQATPTATRDPETNFMLAYAQQVRQQLMNSKRIHASPEQQRLQFPQNHQSYDSIQSSRQAQHPLQRVLEDLQNSGAVSKYSPAELAYLQSLLTQRRSETQSGLNMQQRKTKEINFPSSIYGVAATMNASKSIPSKTPLQESSEYMQMAMQRCNMGPTLFGRVTIQDGIAWDGEL